MVAQEYTNIDPRVQGLQRGANQTAMDNTSRYGPSLSRVQQALMLGVQRQGATMQGQLGRQSQLAGMQAGMQEQSQNQQLGAQAYDSSSQRNMDLMQSLGSQFQRNSELRMLEGDRRNDLMGAIIRSGTTSLGGSIGASDTGSYAGEMITSAFDS